jgi:hypothetical protein
MPLVALVKTLLPEGQRVSLRDHGITELPLQGLNTILTRHGYIIHATKGRDPQQLVACMDTDGRVERWGLFELRPIQPQALGRTIRKQRKGG